MNIQSTLWNDQIPDKFRENATVQIRAIVFIIPKSDCLTGLAIRDKQMRLGSASLSNKHCLSQQTIRKLRHRRAKD